MNVQFQGGDGTSKEEAITITGRINGAQGIILQQIFLIAVWGTNMFSAKPVVVEGGRHFDCFKLNGKPDVWMEATNWMGRTTPMDS